MERLTEKHWRNLDPWECCGQDKYCHRGCHEEGGCTKGCIVPKIYDRLATYEDTGLEPCDYNAMRSALEQSDEARKELNELIRIVGVTGIDKLLEIVQAAQDGRLVVLPCKVGDTVFAAEAKPVIPLSVVCVGLYLEGTEGEDWEDLDNFGKNVFRTREAAEAALKEQEG